MRPGFGQFNTASSEYLRFAAQYGVKDILLNNPILQEEKPGVWSKKELVKLKLSIESYNLQLSAIENVPTHFYDHIMLNGPNKNMQIENMIQNIENMADVGIPIFGYNWMPSHVWRTNPRYIRGGAIATAFDYESAKNYPLTHDREYREDEMWESLEEWIKIITPIAEKKNIRLGIHPCDPPVEKLKNLAVGKSIIMDNYAHKKYPGESKGALINGLGASINYRDPSWQGFEAEDLIATIDLGSITKINSVNVRFLQDQVVWIFLPKKVEIEHSLDGDNFDMLYESYQDNDFSFDQNIYNYLVEPKGIESRYIRIKGYNLDQCPDYHPGAGRPCWLFTDEIIIN